MVINRNESKTFYDDTHLEIRAKQTNLAEWLLFQQAINWKLGMKYVEIIFLKPGISKVTESGYQIICL